MLITVQPNPSWQLSLAQLSPSLFCDIFKIKRQCFLNRLNVLNPKFELMSCEDRLKFILCPPTIDIAKCVSKFLGILTITRHEIDMGLNPQDLNLYIKHVAITT